MGKVRRFIADGNIIVMVISHKKKKLENLSSIV